PPPCCGKPKEYRSGGCRLKLLSRRQSHQPSAARDTGELRGGTAKRPLAPRRILGAPRRERRAGAALSRTGGDPFSERVANGCKISSTLDHESARHGFLFPYQRFVSVVRIAATCGRVDIPIGLVATREFGRGSLWAARPDAAG